MRIFSFDPGTSSTGWAVIDLKSGVDGPSKAEVIAAGVRLFGPPSELRQSGFRPTPARHRYRRRMRSRRRRLVSLLIRAGLLPESESARKQLFALDPYEIRARGLKEPLNPGELGRAICHIAKRRGLAISPSWEAGPVTAHGHPTWGDWLNSRRIEYGAGGMHVRNRLYRNGSIMTDLAPPRSALIHEFNALWSVQGLIGNTSLSHELCNHIHQLVFCGEPCRHSAGDGIGTPMTTMNGVKDPVVRIAAGQLNGLIRAMVDEFGEPEMIVVETFPVLAREAEVGLREAGLKASRECATSASVRKRLALLERQMQAANDQAFCPYTGTRLDRRMVLSSRVQIDHVIPVSRRGCDDQDNLVLCLSAANRAKAGRTPHQAFGTNNNWPEILARAQDLPAGVREQFLRQENDLPVRSKLAGRQQHAMSAILRKVRRIVNKVCPMVDLALVDPRRVAETRSLVKLVVGYDGDGNAKNRHDHRHHAADAIAAGIAAISPSDSVAATLVSTSDVNRLLASVTASAIPARGKSGPMHKQTIYGHGGRDGLVVHRKPLVELSKTEIGRIRDLNLRAALKSRTADQNRETLRASLAAFSVRTGIRRVRLVRKLASGIELADGKTGRKTRIVQSCSNHHLDIVASREGQWLAIGASKHAVRQRGWRPEWERPGCGCKLVMRLHRNDLIEIDGNHGGRFLRRVVRLAPSGGRIYLADPNAAGNLASRHADPGDLFRWEILSAKSLQDRNSLPVQMNILGKTSRSISGRKGRAAAIAYAN